MKLMNYFWQFLFRNQNLRQTVMKNTFWMAVGQLGARLIRVILIVYAARVLGASEWGTFSYALSIAALFTVLIDFGINGILTREASRDPRVQEKYFATGLVIKLGMFAISALLLLGAVPLILPQKAAIALLPIVTFIVGCDSLKDFGASLSRAWEKMEIEAGIHVVTNIAIVLAGFAALAVSETPMALASGYALGTLVGLIFAFYPVRHYFKNLRHTISPELFRPIFAAAWPLAIMGLLTSLMLNTDTLMIGWFLESEQVGYYSAAQRIGQMIFILPGILAGSLFPSFAKLTREPERFRAVLEQSMQFLNLISFPAAVGGAILATRTMGLLYGHEYLPGGPSFMYMCLAIPFIFVGAVLGNAIFAINKERKLFVYSLIGFLGNALFNLLFIPIWGITGAAISTFLNQIIITAYLLYVARDQMSIFRVLRKSRKIILAALSMGVLVWFGQDFVSETYILAALGAVIYFALLQFFKEPALQEITRTFRISGK